MSNKYNIYALNKKKYEAVKQGFSWPAFFFVFIWAFLKKLWLFGLGTLTIFILLVFIETVFENLNMPGTGFVLAFAQLIMSIVLGTLGNSWMESDLVDRKYKYLETIEAESQSKAIQKFRRENR